MDAFLSRWLDSMIAVSWQFSLLFVVVLALMRLFRPWLTPAARHLLWSLLLLRLALPFGLEAPFGVAPRPEVWLDRLSSAARSFLDGAETVSTAAAPAPVARPGSATVVPQSAGASPDVHGNGGRAAAAGVGPGWALVLFIAWISGVISIATLHVRRVLRARRVAAAGDPVPAFAREALERSARVLGLRRLPRIAIVDQPSTAVRIVGVMAPLLELPRCMISAWSAAELEPVFLHELAHLRRGDPLTRAGSNLVQALFFFHPLVWVAARQVSVERELACDDLAASRCPTGVRGYADALLRVGREAAEARDARRFVLAAASDRRALRHRLLRLLADDYRPTVRLSPSTVVTAALGLAIGAGGSIYGERATVLGERLHPGHDAADKAPDQLTPSEARDLLAELVGGEGREVADLQLRGTSRSYPNLGQSFYARPPYLHVRSKPEAPAGLDAASDGIYSFGLDVDDSGRVAAVHVASFLKSTDSFPTSGQEAEAPAALIDWVSGFELEMPAAFAVSPAELLAMIDIEVRGGRATVLTRAPARVSDIREAVERRYRLAPERSLDLLVVPHPDERVLLYRFGAAAQARIIPRGPTRMLIVLDEETHPTYGQAAFGCGTLQDLLRMFGFRENTIEGEAELLARELDTDVLLRRGVEPARLLDDLEAALGERLGMSIEVTARSEARPTIVLRGSLHELAPDPESKDKLATIELNPTAEGLVKGAAGGMARGAGGVGSAAALLTRLLSAATGMPVADETRDATDMVNVRLNHGPDAVRELEEVLRDLAASTGLEVTTETRAVDVVVVSERAAVADR